MLIPALAATGLSLPLPSAVERITAALVPWAEAATLSHQPVTRLAAGSIVLTSKERRDGEAAALETASATLRAQAQLAPESSPSRATAPKPPARGPVPASPAPTAAEPAAPTERAEAELLEPGAAEPAPILASAEPPPASIPDAQPEAGTQQSSNTDAQPMPTPTPEPPDAGSGPPPKPDPKPRADPEPVPAPTEPRVVPAPPEPEHPHDDVKEVDEPVVEEPKKPADEPAEPVAEVDPKPGEAAAARDHAVGR